MLQYVVKHLVDGCSFVMPYEVFFCLPCPTFPSSLCLSSSFLSTFLKFSNCFTQNLDFTSNGLDVSYLIQYCK